VKSSVKLFGFDFVLLKKQSFFFFYLLYLSIYIKDCSYVPIVPLSQANCRTNLHQILHRPPHQLGEGSKHKYDPDPLTPGYPKLQNLNRSLEKKLCFTKNALNFSRKAPGPSWLVKYTTITVRSVDWLAAMAKWVR